MTVTPKVIESHSSEVTDAKRIVTKEKNQLRKNFYYPFVDCSMIDWIMELEEK